MDQLSDFGKEAVRQAPALTILGFAMLAIVFMFLRFLREERISRSQTMHDIGQACHDFQHNVQTRYSEDGREIGAVIDRNTNALDENTKALGRLESLFDNRQRRSNS